MALKNRVWYGIVCGGLGWLLAACTAAHPIPAPPTAPPAATETAPPAGTPLASATSAPATAPETQTVATGQSWINACDTAPVDGGELTFAEADSAMTGRSWLDDGVTNNPFLFSQLTDLSIDDANTLLPDAAQSWDISPDGKVYTYHLRHDVQWHDGQPLTGADVKWTIELYANPDIDMQVLDLLPLSAIAGYADYSKGAASEITGVKGLDDFTLQITLTAPRADFLTGMSGMNLWPQHYFEGMSFKEINDSDKVRAKVIGSGPFQMGQTIPNQEYVLEANDHYYKGRPHLDRLHFRLDSLGAVSWLAGLNDQSLQVGGNVQNAQTPHIEDSIAGNDSDTISNSKSLTTVGAPVPGATVIWPNHTTITDTRVLQALLYALDRQTLAAAVYPPGQAVPFSFDTLDPQHLWIAPNMATYSYDPDKAKALLQEAAWDPNRELHLISDATSDLEKDLLAAIQQYWADVGVKVNVETMSESDWDQSIYANLDFDLAYGCCGVALPHDYTTYSCANLPPEGINTSDYCNANVDTMVAHALSEVDPAKRQALWYKVGAITNDEMLELPLLQLNSSVVVNKRVCNFQFRQWSDSVWPERNPETWFLQPGS